MGVFWVVTRVPTRAGGLFSFPMEHPAQTIDELARALRDAPPIVGEKLSLVDDGRGGKLITRRDPIAVGQVETISPYHLKVWEPDADDLRRESRRPHQDRGH